MLFSSVLPKNPLLFHYQIEIDNCVFVCRLQKMNKKVAYFYIDDSYFECIMRISNKILTDNLLSFEISLFDPLTNSYCHLWSNN